MQGPENRGVDSNEAGSTPTKIAMTVPVVTGGCSSMCYKQLTNGISYKPCDISNYPIRSPMNHVKSLISQ